jgi:hypothetical protein
VQRPAGRVVESVDEIDDVDRRGGPVRAEDGATEGAGGGGARVDLDVLLAEERPGSDAGGGVAVDLEPAGELDLHPGAVVIGHAVDLADPLAPDPYLAAGPEARRYLLEGQGGVGVAPARKALVGHEGEGQRRHRDGDDDQADEPRVDGEPAPEHQPVPSR